MRAAKGCIHALSMCLAMLSAAMLTSQHARANPALLFEVDNGKVLYAEDQDDLWFPASLTKIMTAYVTFNAIKAGKLKLDDKISCSLVATLQPPSKVGLPVGGELTVDVALQAVIIKSANDVTVMLAEAVAGSETAFVDMMNATAKRLGMTRTHFVNTNGLPEPNQYTTARDLAKLSRVVVAEFPEYAHYWSSPAVRIGKRRLGSHNALLKTFPGADGLKTGFTCDSGYNVVASATRDGRRLMAIVLGESSGDERAVRAASLLEHGFQTYDWKQLFNTTDLNNLPVDTAAKQLTSVRSTVTAWSCGNHKAHVKKAKRKRSTKSKTVKKKDDEATGTLKGTIEPKTVVQDTPAKAQ
ncbi:MAG: D-alanyl-D-alanine carboxypeptidase [Hyphomicrobiaceae bacterium]|nr:D-alanyl-D-alanine carboxypeptidase [Hyphomicrobiaceae bacterium]